MRLLDRVRVGPTMRPGSERDGGPGPFERMPDADRARLPIPLIRVVADEPWSVYWRSEEDNWHFDVNYGPIRSPFPFLWVEGRIPNVIHADGEWQRRAGGFRATGALVVSMPSAEILVGCLDRLISVDRGSATFIDQPGASEFIAVVPVGETDRAAVVLPCVAVIGVNDAGKVVGDEDSSVKLLTPYADGHPMNAAAEGSVARPTWFALSLMNCKNVEIEDRAPSIPRKRSERARLPLLSFSHIRLPGRPTSRAEATTQAGPGVALNLVRGHFKHYAEDAPLFGKHVGDFWWNWQARGDAKRGMRVPEYEIGVTSS